ncbi:MAG: hypothetical protein HY240_00755, partial [Actinobacteria bacterium]|nr:hypothetical protein [Actinomycetota bacterium]
MNDLKLIRALGAGEDDYLEDDVAVRARARLQSHIAASRLPDRDRARPRVDEQRRTNRVRALVSLAVSALILAGALLVASADPLPSGSYTILPATAVAAQALDSVRSQVNSEICTQGALDTIGTLAST